MENLYIHIPFCIRKCDYCAFYSESGSSAGLKNAYIDCLDVFLHEHECGDFETIYIGGGTPTILSNAEIERLFGVLHKHIDFNRIKEFSVESNPETLNADKINLMQQYGVSRLSMGVQSFKEKHRLMLGRITEQQAIENAISLLHKKPFKHFNIDLIYDIPGQSVTDFAEDLHRVREAGCDHFSAYNLTIEEQTALAGADFELDEDAACEMFELAGAFKPYRRYEISNYSLDGNSECLHNRNVWRGGTLLGFGPSSASFDGVDRWIQVSDTKAFMSGAAAELDCITHESRMMEIFAVNLRTAEGWQKDVWEKKFTFSWELLLQKAHDASKLYPGLMEIDERSIRLNDKGLLFWNEISMELL